MLLVAIFRQVARSQKTSYFSTSRSSRHFFPNFTYWRWEKGERSKGSQTCLISYSSLSFFLSLITLDAIYWYVELDWLVSRLNKQFKLEPIYVYHQENSLVINGRKKGITKYGTFRRKVCLVCCFCEMKKMRWNDFQTTA